MYFCFRHLANRPEGGGDEVGWRREREVEGRYGEVSRLQDELAQALCALQVVRERAAELRRELLRHARREGEEMAQRRERGGLVDVAGAAARRRRGGDGAARASACCSKLTRQST